MKTRLVDVVNFLKQYPEIIGKIKVDTPYGYKEILAAQWICKERTRLIILKNRCSAESSIHHRYKGSYDIFRYAKDLDIGDIIQTKHGSSKVIKIIDTSEEKDLYDIQVKDVQQYYSNGIVSHNSTIFSDLILFGLFGKTLKNTSNKFIPNRIYKALHPETNTMVRLHFSLGGHEYISEYQIKAKYNTGMQKLFKDGEEITKATLAATQEFLTKEILKSSYDLLKNSIVLSYIGVCNFFTANKATRRSYVESIFDLVIFGKLLEILKKEDNTLDRQVLVLRNNIQSLIKNINEYEEKSKKFDEEKAQDLALIEEGILERTKEIAILEKDILENYPELKKDTEKEQRLIEKRGEIDKTLGTVEGSIRSGKVMISEIEKQLHKHQDIISIICDECKTTVDQIMGFTDHRDRIKEEQQKGLTLEETKNKLNTMREKVTEAIEECRKENARVENILREKNKKENDLKFSRRALDELNANKEKIQKSSDSFKDMIEKSRIELDQKNADIKDINLKMTKLAILKKVVGEEGAKKLIVADLLELLNECIRKYLLRMGAKFTVKFDESFDYEFLTDTGECDYSCFSGGETHRINISTLFSFKDILNITENLSSNVLVLDEIIDANVDTFAIESIIKFLKEDAGIKRQTIFLISHREISGTDWFDNEIELEKRNGFTKIVKDNQTNA